MTHMATGTQTHASTRSALRVLLAVMAAVLAALATWFAWRTANAGAMAAWPEWARFALLILAGTGAAGLVLWLAGWVEFGSLARQRAFYEGVLDACGDACLVTTRNGRAIMANRPYMDLLARAGRQRLVGLDLLFAGLPEVSERIYRLSIHARDGETAEDEFRIPLRHFPGHAGADDAETVEGPTQDHLWLRVWVAPVDDGHVVWRLMDTTAVHARHDEMWHRLQRTIDHLDNVPAGLVSCAADGRILHLNTTLAAWLGIDLAAVPEGRLQLQEIFPEELATRLQAIQPRPGSSRIDTFLADLKTGDGRPLPAVLVQQTDFDPQGQPRPARILVLRRDVLMSGLGDVGDGESHLRATRLMNAAPIGIATLDRNGRIRRLNAALAQITDKARMDADFASIIEASDRPKFTTALQTVTEGRQSSVQVDVSIDSDVDTRAQVTIAATGQDEEGRVNEITVFVIDTTLHQVLMQELKQGQKMQAMGRLVSGIAHDFNNMLTAILGNAELLLQRHRTTDPNIDEIKQIKNHATRAARMVRQLLAYSRKQTLRPEVISLTDLLSDMVSMLRRMIGEKVELVLEHGRDLWPVLADASQMDQVIMNLAVNARDAMPDGGRLVIRTRNVPAEEAARVAPDIMPSADYVLIEVEDTGTGMPPEVKDRIFDPFFTTKDVGKGTGLGLSTVYGIVKQTGGYIFCDSELGKGTVFRIYLPRHKETEEERAERLARQQKSREAPQEDLTGSERILVVEDEAAVRQLAVSALRQKGYEVHEAPSAEIALDMVQEMLRQGRRPDLVVSDVVMPGMDGPTMMKEMRRLGITAPFIFMSGHAEDAFAESLDESAEFTFLAKPFMLKDIVETVRRVLTAQAQGEEAPRSAGQPAAQEP